MTHVTRILQKFKKATYYHSIDFLRGIAALGVTLGHLVNSDPLRFSQLPILQYVTGYGHLGVQVFFVISGFVIPYSMYFGNYKINNISKFVLKRLSRLEPPYIISIFVCIILAYTATLTPYYKGPFPAFS